MNFTDDFDQKLAEMGPPSIFTLTHDKELQFDLIRTRDWLRRFPIKSAEVEWKHCVCVDAATQWPMYTLMTSVDMVKSDEQTTTHLFSTFVEALSFIDALKASLYIQNRMN